MCNIYGDLLTEMEYNTYNYVCYIFITLDFAFLVTYIAVRSTQRLTRKDTTYHIDYSGLEGTKGDASAIRRYFADEEAGYDVVEEEEEGYEEAVGIYFGSFSIL